MEKRRRSKKNRWCDNDNVSQHRDVHVPIEILTEILVRLPSKTLLRFRCVCKSWCTFITSHAFISMHLTFCYSKNTQLVLSIHRFSSQSNNQVRTLTIRWSNTLRKSAYHLRKHVVPWRLCSFVAHCHGLVLLSRLRGCKLLLWNPSINKSLTLPPPPPYLSSMSRFDINYLFGFCPTKNSFKLMALLYYNRGKVLVSISVYLFGDRRWTPEAKSFDSRFLRLPKRKVSRIFHQGVFYWLGGGPKRQNQYGHHEFKACTHLVSLDFDSEEFSYVELPDVAESNVDRFIFALGESLAVFSVSLTSSRIWILEKNDSSRTRREPWRLWYSSPTNLDARDLLRKKCSRGSRAYYNQDSRTIFIHKFDDELLISYEITTRQASEGMSSLGHLIILDSYTESLLMYDELKAIKHNFLSATC